MSILIEKNTISSTKHSSISRKNSPSPHIDLSQNLAQRSSGGEFFFVGSGVVEADDRLTSDGDTDPLSRVAIMTASGDNENGHCAVTDFINDPMLFVQPS